MKSLMRSALCAAVLASGCRQPAPPSAPQNWEKNPGLDPHPAGQNLQGAAPTALPRASFQLDAQRRLAVEAEEAMAVNEEEKLYLKAAQEGQTWAQVKLGAIYAEQSEDPMRLAEGLRLLNAAAEKNDPEALRLLSAMTLDGRGVQQSDREAYVLMRRAADLGSPEAQLELAEMLATGRGMARDPELAIEWARKSAAQGFAPAQIALARQLIGSAEEQRRNEALGLLEKVSESDAQAALFLAAVLASGRFGVAKDELRAESLLTLWAEKGNADCQLALAALYQTSETFVDRRGESLKWLQRAADGGSAKAIEIIRGAGRLDGSMEDEDSYAEAAGRGEPDAQRKLGKIYVGKSGDRESVERGVVLLRAAAAQGDAEALFTLGAMAAAGHGIPQSPTQAFEYCRQAAELGYVDAQYELASMYATGRSVAPDEEKALEWARKAMAQGSVKAKFSVGRLLLLRGRQDDQPQAVELLLDAAGAGLPDSALFLAEAHMGGLYGLPKNPDEAVRILQPLVQRGHKRAIELVALIDEEQEQ